jgi:3-methylcrotonyl-CoA carboxylase alpha subunit
MIQSLLIANRGEIACRIIRTARQMGIRTVAVYSDADAKALHVRSADEAVHIGASPARESYLVGEKIIVAALSTGAEAIHPGYGFLSENAEFAQAVIDAGLIWVGPAPASITAMGLKDAAKTLMAAAGVPVTPGYMGANQDPAFLGDRAAEIGYPVLIKAVAGGGGKGMRKVEDAADFADSLASCQREATSSFGNAHVLIEKYIQRPRHIEVQVFGDTHGNIVHLFERDCSLQRRHQKVIEEAPAPGMNEATREQLCAAAVKAAKAVNYVGAGTIEFIADASEGLRADRIWFMEMNTRLQVEHPVTEEITGVDLVEWQLRVASGEVLPKRQDELSINGWAMEARLYAEDPAKGFLPSVGMLDMLYLPQEPYYPQSLRLETGVEEGDEISPYYDPMIAKIVSHGGTREEALVDLAEACGGVACGLVKSNAWFLKRLCEHPDFVDFDVSTNFIEQNIDTLASIPVPTDLLKQEVAQKLIFGDWHAGVEWEPRWTQLNLGTVGFRLNRAPNYDVHLRTSDGPFESIPFEMDLYDSAADWECSTGSILDENESTFFENGAAFTFHRRPKIGHGSSASDGTILSPMPGRIIAVEVAQGQKVTKGQKLLTLEAMKMEHSLTAPFDGVVAEMNAQTGAQVQVEALLVRIEAVDAE